MNTPQKGSVRYIVFKESDTWYATALELNIVESGDDPKVALFNLFEAIQGYVESCIKVKGSRVSPLNQKTDPEYEKFWKLLQESKKIPSPYQIYTYGHQLI
jgi:predicted RNase H-like HicB family nuclease